MQTAPYRAFLLSFMAGLALLFSGHSVIHALTPAPEAPLVVPFKVPQPIA